MRQWQVTIQLTRKTWMRVARYCMATGLNRSEALRKVIDAGLNVLEKENE